VNRILFDIASELNIIWKEFVYAVVWSRS